MGVGAQKIEVDADTSERGLEQIYVSFCVGNSSFTKRIKKGASYLWVELAQPSSISLMANWRLGFLSLHKIIHGASERQSYISKKIGLRISKYWNGLEDSRCWLISSAASYSFPVLAVAVVVTVAAGCWFTHRPIIW